MQSKWTFLTAVALAGGLAGAAVADPQTELAFIDNIAHHGFERVADLYPDIVYLHTSGNGCRSYPATSYRDIIPPSPAEQTRIGLCALAQMMQEARVSIETVEEARITVRQANMVESVRSVIESDDRFNTLHWEVQVSSDLTISNDDVLLSIDVVALSPGSEETLLALPNVWAAPARR